jgi:hypothetical protein
MQKYKFLRTALAILLAMSLIMGFTASCDSTDASSGTETPASSDAPSDSQPIADDPAPTPPPGAALSGSAIPPPPDNPDNDNCSTIFVPPTPAPDPLPILDDINVTLVIEAGDMAESGEDVAEGTNFREIVSVTLHSGEPKAYFSVLDLLETAEGKKDLSFDIVPSALGPYLDGVTHDGTTWTSDQYGFDGWVFRVNDKFSVRSLTGYSGYYEGTSMEQTPLENGDIVHLFYDFPSEVSAAVGNVAANYVRGVYNQSLSTTTSLVVQLQGHNTYIAPSTYVFYVNNYANLTDGVVAELYAVGGTTPIATATSDSNGIVTFSGSFAAGEKYIVQTESVLRPVTSGAWANRINDAYFELTGSYSKIDVNGIT